MSIRADSSFNDLEYEEKIARFTGSMAILRYQEEIEYQEKLKRLSAPYAQHLLSLKKQLKTMKLAEKELRSEVSQRINELNGKIDAHKAMKYESVDRCRDLNKILSASVADMSFISPVSKPFRKLFSDNRQEHKDLASVIYHRYKRQYERKALFQAGKRFGDQAEALKPRDQRQAPVLEKAEDRMKKLASQSAGMSA